MLFFLLLRSNTLHLRNNSVLDETIVDQFFVVVGAPPAEEVDQRFTIELGGEVLSKAHL